MEAIALDPGEYGGTYKRVGGRLSLDFVNTVSWPGTDHAHEWLSSEENARRWLRAVGLPAPRDGRIDLEVARETRALLSDVLRPLAHGKRAGRQAVAALSEAAAQASRARAIDPSSLQWRWSPPQTTREALAPVLFDAAELVTAGRHDRLRFCPGCEWLFEDRTRNGQRRWCDMADCGSRDKARRYYARTKQEG